MRLARRMLATTLLAIAATAASGAPLAVTTWPVDTETVGLLVADRRAPLVALQLEFPAGSWSTWVRQAEADRAFLMQLHDPGGRLRREADRLGLDPILHVGPRAATLRVSCLKPEFPELLEWVRAVLGNDEIDRDEVRRRRREERLGWRFAMKTPGFRARREHARLLFQPDDPRLLRFEPPGRQRSSAEELVRARDRVLGIPTRVIAFAGDLSADEAARAARGLLPPAAGEALPAVRTELLAERYLRAEGEGGEDVDVSLNRLTQVYFSYGRTSLPFDDPDYPAFLVADHVLGGHFYSRLYRALRHEGGETYGAFSTNHGDVTVDLYALSTFTRTANAEKTEHKLRAVLARFHDGGITDTERLEALGFLRGRLEFARQAPQQVLDRHLRERRLGLPPDFLDELVDRAARLELIQINRFIERYFDPALFTMVRVVPAK